MIAYIKGVVGELSPTEAVIEAAGVGYQLAISLNTFAALQGKETAKVYVKEVIREDAHDLFGFFSKEERTLFEALTSVNGIGGATARMVLSAFTPAELAEVIHAQKCEGHRAESRCAHCARSEGQNRDVAFQRHD